MKFVKKVWAILKNNNWKVLIFKEKLNEGGKFLYNIPKWTVNEKDKNLTEAIKREIFEETNLKNIILLNFLDIYPKYYDEYISMLFLFEFEVINYDDISNINIEKDETISEYIWINKEDLYKINKSEFVDERIYSILEKYCQN